jgi:hypothetical protein
MTEEGGRELVRREREVVRKRKEGERMTEREREEED